MNQESLKPEKAFSDTGPQMLFPMVSGTCEKEDPPGRDQPFVVGAVKTPTGEVSQVSASLTAVDYWE